VTRPIRRQRILLWGLVFVSALVAGVGVAGARGSRAASLKVSIPASMARGSVLTVRASGYSGSYNTVSWSSTHSACAPPNADTITMQTVPRDHTFNVKLTNIFGAPGTMTVCVYLFTGGSHANVSKGHYLVKSRRVKVS
jgi:hypothetical protein